MSTMPERIIAVIDDVAKAIRFGEDADTHVKQLPIKSDANITFVKEVFRKLDKHSKKED